MPKKIAKMCLFTNDVETTSIWFNALREATGNKVIKEGMPLLLDLYEKHYIKSTFFFTADFAQNHPEVVKMILPFKHEVGSHGYSHEVDLAFDVLPYKKQIEHLSLSKKILEDISGQEVISFRAPALRVNNHTARALIEAGFKIDSSIPSQRFDFFMSMGTIKKLKWFFAPRHPYHTSLNSLARRGRSPLIEVPLTAIFFPYVGTTLRIFPFFTHIQRHLIAFESSINYKPVVFDIHPNELIDESDEDRVINRRSTNPISYFIKDYLRSHLKTKNLGRLALFLYESEIEFYKKKNFSFSTIKDYCKKINLLS